MTFYRIVDQKTKSSPALSVSPDQARFWNNQGWGIFWTVNNFNGRRLKENLVQIRAWAVDMDTGTKDEMLKKLKAGLIPSYLVETKRGFQSYFFSKDATVERHAIIMNRLVQFYGADPRAKDLSRLLRVPGFYHLKDPSNPFLIAERFRCNARYSEFQMFGFYPPHPSEVRGEKIKHQCNKADLMRSGIILPGRTSNTFWERVWNMNCEEALGRLSGSLAVKGEVYTFKRNPSGTKNIFVNGKSTSCWIDVSGRIGSMDGGGPTIFQWLKWYGHDNKTAVCIMKDFFSELWRNL